MEVYILDSLYRRTAVVDRFESLIWTERMKATGDFELVIHSSLENRRLFVPGVRIAMNESYRVMTVETVEDATDDEARRVLRIAGPSLESVMKQRLAMAALTDLTTDPKWTIEGFPKDIAEQLFHDICVTGILDPGDVIPGVVEDTIFPDDTISSPSEEIVYSFDPMTLYEALKNLCDAYNMGFRLVRDLDTTILYFDIYMGSDRTAAQTVLPAVIFSPDLENLRNTSKLTTTGFYKNVAYVVSPVGHEVVYPLDVDPDIEGFERRVLFVRADDITDVVPADATEKMIQRGVEELSKNRLFVGLDGELAGSNQYKYGLDYNLGDMVELRDDDGTTSQMQVTEQIFVSDKEGDRAYPTLSMNTFVTPGSWLSMGPGVIWEDMGAVEYWDTMP